MQLALNFTFMWIGWTAISAIGSLLAAIVAGVYTYFTYHLLQTNRKAIDRSNRLYEFQFYKEISERLNSQEARNLTDLCQNNLLKIDYSIGAKDIVGNTVSANYLNRILLNELESIAVFWKSELINIITVDTGFGYKILAIGNSQAIVDHVIKSRVTYPHTFSQFEDLYNEIYKISTAEGKTGYRARFIH
ncbi:hypothetical protein FW778_14610 [Ginsengibacter hankyongi]|uniref:DUF4760 domain-containing protein n=1 Tax=Ginsengibacter hankyongi TaxID=2607284 RepID=A0A5J5IE54_9BACT|nr:hypothetical protein [Ginsengibacter hankyongi]KAA9037996.1 hypothetical protein FW778_14610 [Ginsengibacter hankyongi]